jgi:threonine dehydratase
MSSKIVQLQDVLAAREVISARVHRTPTVSSTYLSERTHTNLHLKLELFQKTGCFKVRGVTNKLNSLTAAEKSQGVITLSAGNHAQAVAWGSRQLGIPATLIMPEGSVQSKIDATQGYGGEVLTTPGNLLEFCLSVQKERGLLLVHPFDDPLIIAGHGTIGLEIVEDVPDVDCVIVGVGGGGLISGIATAIKAQRPNAKVIGVEPEGAPTMTRSLEKGEPVHLETVNTVADGLSAPFVGQLNLDHVQKFVEEVVIVSDFEIVNAMKLIWARCKVLAEPAAAATVAALLEEKVSIPEGATVVCVLSGGNVDMDGIEKLLATG